MSSIDTLELYSLNRSTYVNLRWIAFIGQIFAVVVVQFILKFEFQYIICFVVILVGVLTNIHLHFNIKENQIKNSLSLCYLIYDIFQLGILFFLTGGITNPFVFLIIVPAVFSSQYLAILSSFILSSLTIIILITLTFFTSIYLIQAIYTFMHLIIIFMQYHYQ